MYGSAWPVRGVHRHESIHGLRRGALRHVTAGGLRAVGPSNSGSPRVTLWSIPVMPVLNSILIGPAPDMLPGMGLDIAPVIGGIHSATTAVLMGRAGSEGMVDIGVLAQRVRHRVRLGIVRHSRPTRLRNSKRSCERCRAGCCPTFQRFPRSLPMMCHRQCRRQHPGKNLLRV